MATINSADWGYVAVISAECYAHVAETHRLAQGGIKPYPAGAVQIDFRPGVRCLSADHFLD